ncbi:hypothetical protein Mal35_09150 [Gimesia maris]|nr:hypothetical protein Mal35_09150 [Gimesia maris]
MQVVSRLCDLHPAIFMMNLKERRFDIPINRIAGKYLAQRIQRKQNVYSIHQADQNDCLMIKRDFDMSSTLIAIAIAASVGGDPIYSDGAYGAYGTEAIPYEAGQPMTSSGVTGGIYGDPRFPFDSQYPWQHGYFQEISPYSGYHYFKPYNYRHVLSQTQTANGWGITPQLAYSQHFWNRYHEQAAWKNYALPPREEDIEEIQQRKRDFQERREELKSSYYQPQQAMIPVDYQQQAPYQQQYQQPAQLQQQYRQPQYQQPQPQQQYQRPRYQQQYQQPQLQNSYPVNSPGYEQKPVYINR